MESKSNILVVDDNPDLRRYISALLSPSYQVSLARDGVEGLAAAIASLPDLIVSDVMMPNMDGFALVRELRATPATASIPVILLSARAGEEAAVAGLGAGSDEHTTADEHGHEFEPAAQVGRVGQAPQRERGEQQR